MFADDLSDEEVQPQQRLDGTQPIQADDPPNSAGVLGTADLTDAEMLALLHMESAGKDQSAAASPLQARHLAAASPNIIMQRNNPAQAEERPALESSSSTPEDQSTHVSGKGMAAPGQAATGAGFAGFITGTGRAVVLDEVKVAAARRMLGEHRDEELPGPPAGSEELPQQPAAGPPQLDAEERAPEEKATRTEAAAQAEVPPDQEGPQQLQLQVPILRRLQRGLEPGGAGGTPGDSSGSVMRGIGRSGRSTGFKAPRRNSFISPMRRMELQQARLYPSSIDQPSSACNMAFQ